MGLAKRYVKELAADRKRDLKRCMSTAELIDMKENIEYCKEEINRIDTIIEQCEYGYLSSFEAVRQIMR